MLMDQPSLPPEVNENILPNSTLAIVSLVSALLGFTFVPVVGGIVALVTGYMARNETRSIPPKASGDGMATAGIILGWVQMGLLVVGLCCAIAYFVLIVGIFASSSGQ
jgi:hypothetical protein